MYEGCNEAVAQRKKPRLRGHLRRKLADQSTSLRNLLIQPAMTRGIYMVKPTTENGHRQTLL
jgi:hypothetical protein